MSNFKKDAGYGLAESIRMNLGLVTMGRLLLVCPATDPNYDRLSQIFDEDPNGRVRLFTTIAAAYTEAVDDANDVIALSGNATHTLTSMLTISKDRLHFIGLGATGRKYGQSSKVSIGVTTAATDIAAIKNLGVRNSFTNIKFSSDNTLAQALSVVAEGGEYATYKNCEFYRSTLLDGATSCELLLNGDSPHFIDCTFGSLATGVTGNVIHPCVRLANGQVGAGLVTRDAYFKGCNFWRKTGTSGTTTAHVHLASDDDLERLMEFEDCKFVNDKLGAATMAVAISSAASLTKSYIFLSGSTTTCGAITKLGTATGIISGLNVKVATATIGIQAS